MAIRTIKYRDFDFRVSYELLNTENNMDIIFLHGWSSSKNLMKGVFKNTFKHHRHIYIDLIGFGESSQPQIPLSTFDYAKIIDIFLEQLKIEKNIIVGHSFGGKVATLLKPKKLALLSTAGIVYEKTQKVKTKIFISKILKKLKFLSFHKFLVSKDANNLSKTMYETFKHVINEDFRDVFSRCKTKTYIIWGESDKTTPVSMGEEIETLIPNSKLYRLMGDHFFFTDRGEIIEDILKS
jgi:non-heme chloroperoxidase